MGNDAMCKVIGLGTIKVKMFDEVVRIFIMSDIFQILRKKIDFIRHIEFFRLWLFS
jgi:hypothetical protein